MSKKHEQARAEAVGVATYIATIESMEPNISPTDPSASHTSAAISLKRIADVAELFAVTLIKDYVERDKDIRDWSYRHGFGDLWDRAKE